MDIYAYAKSINYGADYMDMYSGNIYKIQEYGKALATKKNPTDGLRIRVTDADGNTIGYAQKKN